jgi:signal transduction protein with GAF and PtsI domain
VLPPNSPVLDPERLAALKAANLLDTPAEEAFDQLARLACRIMEAPVALVSLVDQERQFFKSCIGPVPEHIQSERETPLTHSFCRYAVESGRGLIIEDAKTNPLVMSNPAVTENGVGAYAGFPLVTAGGQALGTLCVLDTKPRQWSQAQLEQLASLASVVSTTIEYRSAAQAPQPKPVEPAGTEENSRSGASLTEAIAAYFTRLDEYRLVAERAASTEELDQEAYWRQQVLATEADMLASVERYRQRRGEGAEQVGSTDGAALAELAKTCEEYFRAQRQRAEAIGRFQRTETSLDQVERAGALMLQTEQALRSSARNYSLRIG